nr:phosphoenolpyruvate-protein phosphotransferase PtsP [Pseudomonadota bacterium]
VVRRVHRAGRPVSVCGEMAGDPAAALLLMGMGVDSLSMSPANLPKIKWVVRAFAFAEARRLLAAALRMDSAAAIRQLLHGALEERGLGRLIRGEN